MFGAPDVAGWLSCFTLTVATGTAATIAVLGYVWSHLGWQRFTADPDADNTRSVEFWTKVGLKTGETDRG